MMPILWFLTPWLTGFDQVDIELPEDMSLREAHDIGESLQNKLEALTEVERAYVHLDYESTHRPEHTIHGYMVWE
jgi:divalent metal cation (Fe/Co/Zn/Cd) transporter